MDWKGVFFLLSPSSLERMESEEMSRCAEPTLGFLLKSIWLGKNCDLVCKGEKCLSRRSTKFKLFKAKTENKDEKLYLCF